MNFMLWLKSLDELLYEIMSWLVFFPLTLWRSVTRPLKMMEYSREELHGRVEEQYNDTLSPPMFLFLALILSHVVELSLDGGVNPIIASNRGLAALVSDDWSLLVLRLLLFSLFPTLMATRFVRASGQPLTRQKLKMPFYVQCYPAAAFALFFGLGIQISHLDLAHARGGGLVIALLSLVVFYCVETLWFTRHLKRGAFRGALHAGIAMFESLALFVLLAVLFVR